MNIEEQIERKFENSYLRLTCLGIRRLCCDYRHPELGEKIVEYIAEMLNYVDVVNKE